MLDSTNPITCLSAAASIPRMGISMAVCCLVHLLCIYVVLWNIYYSRDSFQPKISANLFAFTVPGYGLLDVLFAFTVPGYGLLDVLFAFTVPGYGLLDVFSEHFFCYRIQVDIQI